MNAERIVIPKGEHFFSHDRRFYKTFLSLTILIVLQNIVTFSVNIADNLMLGSYSQPALSGAAAINQIQFLVQAAVAMGLGQGIAILGSQYWGQRKTDPIQKITGIALKGGVIVGLALTIFALISPQTLAGIFTDDPEILKEAVSYLSVLRFSYVFFICTNLLLASLRSVQIVGIAFKLTVMALVVNVTMNYCLIFGKFGLPEMGIQGAAIGTLTARILEFIVLLVYINKSKKLPFRYRLKTLFQKDAALRSDFIRVTIPCVVSEGLFAGAVAIQTVIFGHMSADAIAANAMASTMMQYAKMIPISAASSTSVIIGEAVGNKDWKHMREYVHSLQIIYLVVGVIAALMFVGVSHGLIGIYDLTPGAIHYAKQMFVILPFVIIACSYQSPLLCGVIPGGGDTHFTMMNDIYYAGCFTIPVCLIAAFVFHLGVVPLVLLMNVDQFVKCITNGVKANSYTWIKPRTREEEG